MYYYYNLCVAMVVIVTMVIKILDIRLFSLAIVKKVCYMVCLRLCTAWKSG